MLFLSWSWNGLSYSRMISATTKLRYLYLLLPRATKAESCSVEINHPRAYLLPRKYVNRKWPLCWGKGPGGHVQEKQRHKLCVKCTDVVCTSQCACAPPATHMQEGSIRAESSGTSGTHHFTKGPHHPPPSDHSGTATKKQATRNHFSFPSVIS